MGGDLHDPDVCVEADAGWLWSRSLEGGDDDPRLLAKVFVVKTSWLTSAGSGTGMLLRSIMGRSWKGITIVDVDGARITLATTSNGRAHSKAGSLEVGVQGGISKMTAVGGVGARATLPHWPADCGWSSPKSTDTGGGAEVGAVTDVQFSRRRLRWRRRSRQFRPNVMVVT